MIILEITMVIVGLAAIIYSYRVIESHEDKENTENIHDIEHENNIEQYEKKLQDISNGCMEKMREVYHELDENMNEMSNNKIMGMSEYSDGVIDKIEKNHAEVVFLYDMLNEKKEEIEKSLKEIDALKSDLKEEVTLGYQKIKEQEKNLDEIKKEMELDFLQFRSEKEQFHSEITDIQTESNHASNLDTEELESDQLISNLENESEESKETVTSVYDDEIARIEEQEAGQMQELSEKQNSENNNDEIIALYKKGRSILEISKMLQLGQGEVKFVIDLYNAR